MVRRVLLASMLCLCTLPACAAPAPDASQAKLAGDGMWQDSLSLALQAAGRLFGREADRETLTCLTANAFAPAIDLREDCTAHWHCEARLADRAIGNGAAFLGLRARRLAPPPPSGLADEAEARREGMRRWATAVRDAMNHGAVVIPLDGWQVDGPHGFTHWAWAGVVTQADPDAGTVLAAHLNGFADNPIVWAPAAWTLAPSPTHLSQVEADRQMLRHALDRIRGNGAYRRKGSDVFGLDAMDAWIRHMRTVVGFCAPCHSRVPGSGAGDADDNARHMQHGARTVAAYLERRQPDLPEAVRPHLAQVAVRYRRIAELLVPCLTGVRGDSYRQIIGDLGKQRNHAETVLRPVRAELAAAANEIEQALKAWPRK